MSCVGGVYYFELRLNPIVGVVYDWKIIQRRVYFSISSLYIDIDDIDMYSIKVLCQMEKKNDLLMMTRVLCFIYF